MKRSENRIPELLAPAGNVDALRAAVANGADAVYLGVDKFNARRGAENFTLDSLAAATRHAHLHGCRVYLTLNVLVLEHEMHEALDVVDRAWESGVDAIIVQDLGLLGVVRESMPHVRIHASTQVNAHNSGTVEQLARLGVSRVTLARELSIEEIGRIVESADVQVESFVHGALCVCYSGQCLMSSIIGQRSANRGMCAQPCRLAYELVNAEGVRPAIPGAHLLSPRDLAGITVLPRLVETGVAALKIEGRMKSPEYVALVTGVYRSALDRLAADPEAFAVREGELAVLSEAFNRGFSEAYLVGERGNDMMSYMRPNNRGITLGRVTAARSGSVTIALDSALDAEDTIEFWTSAGRFAQRAGTLEFEGVRAANAPAGKQVTLAVEGSAAVGDRVFRVANAALLSAARRSFASGGTERQPLDFAVRVVTGEPLSVVVTDSLGRTGNAEGAVVESARTKVVTSQEVAEHIGRLGGTAYEGAGWDIALSPDAGIGFSALHAARRAALEAYEAGLLGEWSDRSRTNPTAATLPRPSQRHTPLALEVACVSLEQAQLALLAGADAAQVSVWALDGKPADRVVPAVPRIAHDREVEAVLARLSDAPRAVVGNLGLIRPAAALGVRVDAHWSLNAVNPWSVSELAETGAEFVWLSPELSGRQIAQLVAGAVLPCGIGVYGRQELMVTEHCMLMAEGECSRSCATCARRRSSRRLRDRKGYEFPVMTDATGRTHVYNSVLTDLTTALPEIVDAGVAAVRLDLTDEPGDDISAIVRHFRAALEAAQVGAPVGDPLAAPATAAHFFRGVR